MNDLNRYEEIQDGVELPKAEITIDEMVKVKQTLFEQQWANMNRAQRRNAMKAEKSSVYTKKYKSEGSRKQAIIAHNKKVDNLEKVYKQGHL